MNGPVPSTTVQLEVSVELIDVTSMSWTPNWWWTYTDTEGHDHRYDHGYPTLDLVIDASHWCDGTEGAFTHDPHDPHEHVDESHYECKLCRQVIEPKMDPPGTPKSIPGEATYSGEGTRTDGARIRCILTDDEIAQLHAARSPEETQAVFDAVPAERITHSTATFW